MNRKEKFKHNLKQKYAAILVTTISITIFITYSFLHTSYYEFHAKRVTKILSPIFQEIGEDIDKLDETIELLHKNVDITLYVFNNVNELLEDFPLDTNSHEILSTAEMEQLANGELIVNRIDMKMEFFNTEEEFQTITFTYPLIKNNKVEKLLFIHHPVSGRPNISIILLTLSLCLAIVAARITYLLMKRFFGEPYKQLKNIKQAAIDVSNGNFDAKIKHQTDDEIGEISEVFNMMSFALKENQERLKEFAQDFSHELRTPLTYIKTYNQALMDGIVSNPKEQIKYHRLIDHETVRLQKIAQTLLDFSKLSVSAVELDKQPIAFAQIIEDIMMKYEPIFIEKQIQFNMQLDYDVIIEGDEERIEQIIQNIIHNAIRYSKEQPRINITLTKQSTSCLLAITDNGIGISQEHLSIITNRFVRVNKVKKDSGTGLGLSIVEKLMELHRGEMKIESELGVGTTVNLVFPLCEKVI